MNESTREDVMERNEAMHTQKSTPERLGAFSDAVIAVIITIMVLELKAPEDATFSALVPLWAIAISYAVSYLFVAIIWINHHHLLRFVDHPTHRLIWVNFAHLFAVSFVPFATAWVARSQLAAAPVATYAAIFVCVNIAYRIFEREVFAQADATLLTERAIRMARRRSLATLGIFMTSGLVALVAPYIGFSLICGALILYLRPEPPGVKLGPL
jgi:uncharacterized membrane protein